MTVQIKKPIDSEHDLVDHPLKYGEKYNKNKITVAVEHCLTTPDVLYKYEKKQKTPSLQTRRISQLLDFIRVNGFEPPAPFWE